MNKTNSIGINKLACALLVLAGGAVCASLALAGPQAGHNSVHGLERQDEADFEGAPGGGGSGLRSAGKSAGGPYAGKEDESEVRLGLGAKAGPGGVSVGALEQVSKLGVGGGVGGVGGGFGGLASAGLEAFGYESKLPFNHQAIPFLPYVLPPGHPKVDLSAVAKLAFNPFELARTISKHLNIPLDKFIDLIGKQLIFGVEALLYPLVASVKIFERVFVPDKCTLRLMCKLGNYLDFYKDVALRLSPNFVDVSAQVKALTDGVAGRDCELAFAPCVPKLRQPFQSLAAY